MMMNGRAGGRHGHDDEEDRARTAPLLPVSNEHAANAAAAGQADADADADDPASARLLPRLAALLRASRAAPGALCLALLSVAEAYTVSRGGAVAGRFYAVFVDRDAAALGAAAAAAAGWYSTTALLGAGKMALADGLAWAWRARLAGEMQTLYLTGAAHYRLAQPQQQRQRQSCVSGGGADNENDKQRRRRSGRSSRQHQPSCLLDSPDQRIAQDLPNLTRAMADAAAVLVAAPFGVLWYGRLVAGVFGGALWPVLAAASFFAFGASVQRLLVKRVARLVFALEAAEGAYRFAHARLRGDEAEGVALYSRCSAAAAAAGGGAGNQHQHHQQQDGQHQRQKQPQKQQKQQPQPAAPAELAALDARLQAVLECEGRLIPARWVLAAATRLIDYGGALLNYACVASAVFGVAGASFSPGGGKGGGGGESGGGSGSGGGGSSPSSPGDVAQHVSLASFYLLTLIYSFTQVLDLSRTASDAAGLAARVGGLLEDLRARARAAAAAGAVAAAAAGGDDGDGGGGDGESGDGFFAAAAAAAAGDPDTAPLPDLLLAMRDVHLSTAGGRGAPVVCGLTLGVSAPGGGGGGGGEGAAANGKAGPPLIGASPGRISSLLVVGPSGCGKTTLLRAVAGLAPLDAGEIDVAGAAAGGQGDGGGCGSGGGGGGGVFFVPQRPLAAPGATLRLQLTYPHAPCACSVRAAAAASSHGAGRRPPGVRGAAAAALALRALGLGWREERRRRDQEEKAGGPSDSASSSVSSSSCCPVCGGDASLYALLDEVGLAYLPARLGLASLDAPLRLGAPSPLPPPPPPLSAAGATTTAPPSAGLKRRKLTTPLAADWASVLSPGELQRLAFARLLRQRPALAFLDEAAASLPEEAARSLYAGLRRRGCAYVSCGHGSGLRGLHEATLKVLADGRGGWVLERN